MDAVYIRIGPSAFAFDTKGEILETVEFDTDGTPEWTDAAIVDGRAVSVGDEYANEYLSEALRMAERVCTMSGDKPRRVGDTREMRVARVPTQSSDPDKARDIVNAYLYSSSSSPNGNYNVRAVQTDDERCAVIIGGYDSAGFTLDVILARLASGLLFGEELEQD